MQADSAGPGADSAVDSAVDTATGNQDENPATRNAALTLAALLLLAGVAAAVAPLAGVAGTADGSRLQIATAAAWVAVLPGLLAVLLALRGPALGLAATAGGGVMAAVRLLADLSLLAEPDGLTRPELFYETTDTARPFAVGAGGWVLIAADVLAVVVGLVAIGRLVGALGLSGRIGDELLPPPASAGAVTASGPDRALEAAGAPDGRIGGSGTGTAAGTDDGAGTVEALTNSAPPRTNLNLPMISVGFLGGIMLMLSALEIPYTGGYLGLRILPLGTSLTGVLAAAATPLIAGVTVVVAAALPRPTAIALLAGTAVAAAVPSLTAAVAVLSGVPASLSASVWWGLAGALVLGLSGLLARRPPEESSDADAPAVRSGAPLAVAAAVLALAAAALSFAASRLPLMLIDGVSPQGAVADGLEQGRWPFAPAALPLLAAGLLTLVPPVSRAGRAATAVVWAGPVYALVQAVAARSIIVSSEQYTLTVELPDDFPVHSWTAGSGLWLGGLAALLAVVAAVLAVVSSRRDAEASLQIAVDDSVAASRTPRLWIAGGLTAVTVVALSLPIAGAAGELATVSLWGGYGLETWGVWAVGVAVVGAVWAAAGTRHPMVAAALPVAAAAVAVQPLLLSDALTRRPGFERGAGTWAVWALVALLLLAAPAFAMLAARLRTVDAASWRSGWTSGTAPSGPAGRGPGSAAAATVRRPADRGRKAGRT